MTHDIESAAEDARWVMLGLTISQAAMLEQELRSAFSALVGSKYGATVAGGQSAAWLIEMCTKLAHVHRDLGDVERAELKAALRACREANERRNELIHGLNPGPDHWFGERSTLKGGHVLKSTVWTLEDIKAVGKALANAGSALLYAIRDGLGFDSLGLESELRREDAWHDHGIEDAGVPYYLPRERKRTER